LAAVHQAGHHNAGHVDIPQEPPEPAASLATCHPPPRLAACGHNEWEPKPILHFDIGKKMAELDHLKRKQTILAGWLADYRQRSEQLPYVQQSLELTNYQLDVVSSFPVDLPSSERTEIVESFSHTVDFWQSFATA
jgi:hypothetical protein